jgi:hypothetical protein
MGLFNFFKRKKLSDEVFGELSYTTFKDSSDNFYEGTVNFHNKKLGVTIDADKAGPTKLQQDFFLQIDKNYLSLQATVIIPFLKEKLWDDCQIIDFDKEFEFDALSIPRLPQTPIEWSICYFSFQLNHYVTIYFGDFQPTNIQIDG